MYVLSFRINLVCTRLILLYLNSEQEQLHEVLIQFNQSTLYSDHLASWDFFPSTCLSRLTHDSTHLRVGICRELDLFSGEMVSASCFQRCIQRWCPHPIFTQ